MFKRCSFVIVGLPLIMILLGLLMGLLGPRLIRQQERATTSGARP